MSARRRLVAVAGSLAALVAAPSSVSAQEQAPYIWYRSSQGCPDGKAFLQRLRGRAQDARLAQVNDRIDFVVTLGSENGRSSGRLERQTTGSTVAIRDIETSSCEEAADVLALTLTLALDPDSRPDGEAATASPAPEERALPGPEVLPATAERAEPDAAASRSTPPDARRNRDESPPHVEARASARAWLLGGELGAVTGPSGSWGPWAGLFLERESAHFALPGASARLTLAFSRVEDNAPGLAFSTFVGRLDGCPVDFVGTELRVRPCFGVELGSAIARGLASSGLTDQGFWAAALASGRASWLVTPGLALDLDAGLFVPFVRYTFTSASGDETQEANPIGFFGALGAAWRTP